MTATPEPFDQDLGAWIALKMVRGVGCVLYQGLLRAFGHPRLALRLTRMAREQADRAMHRANGTGRH